MDRASPDPERLGHPQDTNTLRKVLSHLAFGRAVYFRTAELYLPSYPDRPAIRLGTVTQPPSACILSSSMPNSFGPGSLGFWLHPRHFITRTASGTPRYPILSPLPATEVPPPLPLLEQFTVSLKAFLLEKLDPGLLVHLLHTVIPFWRRSGTASVG